MILDKLLRQHAADTTFSGLGIWEVYAPGRRLVGRVACNLATAPPFVVSDNPDYLFAEGYFMFALGVVKTEGEPAGPPAGDS